MNDRPRGLYEVLITEAIASQLRDLGDEFHAIRDGVRSAEAPDRLALHLGRIVQRAIAGVNDADRVAVGVALARKLIDQIDQTISGSQAGSEAAIEPGSVLRAVLGRTPDGRVETMPEPLIIARSSGLIGDFERCSVEAVSVELSIRRFPRLAILTRRFEAKLRYWNFSKSANLQIVSMRGRLMF